MTDTSTESAPTGSSRTRAKADRRAALLTAAARLFADNGFSQVSLEELGAAAGVSGPAVYRHFASKQAVLAALLVGVSESLLAGGQAVIATHPTPESSLRALIDFHVDFAVRDSPIIRVHDRDLHSLSDESRHRVRELQRRYSELWVDVVAQQRPESRAEIRVRVQAVFGLINSTPYAASGIGQNQLRALLADMATAACLAPEGEPSP